MVNIIKYKSIWSILLSATLLFGACESGLDLQPKSEIGEGVFYKNDKEIDLALISVYNSLQGLMMDEWVVTEFRSDNSYMNPDASESKDLPMRELDRFVQNSQNKYVESYWRAAYRTIALANTVLGNIDVVVDANLKAKYTAEAKFMRAFAYFRLVRIYGGVFYIDRRISGAEAKTLSRSSEAQIYELIISDLKYAQENLPASVISTQTGRVTKYVAKGILAKALLTRKEGADVADAKVLLDEIEASGMFALQATYESVFNVGNEYNSEILFAVRYMSGSVGLGGPFANFFAPQQSEDYVVKGNGDGYNYPSASLTTSFEENDSRKAVNMQESYIGRNGSVVVDSYVAKYMSNLPSVDDAENDWPILRYADVLLLKAEAMNELEGPSDEAVALLNQVRTRAGLSEVSLTDINSKFAFSLALEAERRVEFAFENQRWFDLLRTKRTITVMNQHFRTEFQYNDPDHIAFKVPDLLEWKLLLPIPQFEIDLNPNITQNYGY